MFGYMLINPSRDVVVSLACYSYYKVGVVQVNGDDYLIGDVTPRIF